MRDDHGERWPRRVRSGWTTTAVALVWLVLLAIVVRDVAVVIQLWLITVATTLIIAHAFGRTRIRSVNVDSKPGTTDEPLPAIVTPMTRPLPEPGSPATAALPGPFIMTADEVATLLRIDVTTVINGIRDGTLPGNEIAGQWRVRASALLAWVDGLYGEKRTNVPRPRRATSRQALTPPPEPRPPTAKPSATKQGPDRSRTRAPKRTDS